MKKKNRYLMSYPFLFCSINYNEDKISTHYPLNKVGLIFFNIKKYLSDYNILKNKKNWNFSYWFEWVSYFFYGKKILIYWEFPQLLAWEFPLKNEENQIFLSQVLSIRKHSILQYRLHVFYCKLFLKTRDAFNYIIIEK